MVYRGDEEEARGAGEGAGLRDADDHTNADGLSVSETTTQIYSEEPSRQLANLVRLFLYDHKLQTVLPLAFFTGLQGAFIGTTFAKVLMVF